MRCAMVCHVGRKSLLIFFLAQTLVHISCLIEVVMSEGPY